MDFSLAETEIRVDEWETSFRESEGALRATVRENTASARAPAITAHEPLDTSPSLENHAGHRLRHRRPPPVRGREEVLRRQEGTPRTARAS